MTWLDVTELILKRWPAGPGNKPWDPEILSGYVAEMEIDLRRPERAILGLRHVVSHGFVPSVDQVREAARQAQGPPTAAQIKAATDRHEAALVAARSQRHLQVA
jgi:hypothetical protein